MEPLFDSDLFHCYTIQKSIKKTIKSKWTGLYSGFDDSETNILDTSTRPLLIMRNLENVQFANKKCRFDTFHFN